MRWALLAAALGWLALAGCSRGSAPYVAWSDDEVALVGLPADELGAPDAESRFTVHTASGLAAGHPALAGSVRRGEGALVFTPAFALAPGERYVARWLAPEGEVILRAERGATAAAAEPRARVVALYPSGSELPSNALRLYLHFSYPMSAGEAGRRVRLLRLDGERAEPVEAPFVAPEHELWDAERRRLTLLFDPGRIKLGVGPNESIGPVLAEGARYRLEVDAEWKDARGAPLAEGFAHEIVAGPPDRRPPDPASWTLTPPPSPAAPLELAFPEPLDRALLERALRVETARGEALEGEIEVSGGELGWSFRPRQPWKPGAYRLLVAPILEDPAGNRPGRAFDAPITDEPPAPPPLLELEFAVGLSN